MAIASPVAGQATPDAAQPDSTAAVPGSHLEVYLVTAGLGDSIWERFGHNAIWIRDRERGTDWAYNWGIFDFRQENFITNLIQGRMLYAMRPWDIGPMVGGYRNADRHVEAVPINLTPSERLELLAFVQAMDTEENRYYIYNYYLDNCSTRVRDALDAVLGGQIEERWAPVTTETSFRWHTRRLLQDRTWAYYGIQFVLGNPGDERISAWDEMFLPRLLQNYLEETTVTHDDGTVTPLLGEPQILNVASRAPAATEVRSTWLISGAVGLAIALLLGFTGSLARKGSTVGRWAFGMLGGGWALLTGLLGTGLILSWFLTDHVHWRWNENAFLFNPIGLVAAWFVIRGMIGKGWAGARRWTRPMVTLGLLGLIVQVLPWFDQVNADMLLLVGPAHLMLSAGVLGLDRVARGAEGPAAPAG